MHKSNRREAIKGHWKQRYNTEEPYDLRQILSRPKHNLNCDAFLCDESPGAAAILDDLRRNDFWSNLLYQNPDHYRELMQRKLCDLNDAFSAEQKNFIEKMKVEADRDRADLLRENEIMRDQMNKMESRLVQYENDLESSDRRIAESNAQVVDLENQLNHESIRSETAHNMCHRTNQKLKEQESKIEILSSKSNHWEKKAKEADANFQKSCAEHFAVLQNFLIMEQTLKEREITINQLQYALNQLKQTCSELETDVDELKRALLEADFAAKKCEDEFENEKQGFKDALVSVKIENQQLEEQKQRLIEEVDQLNAISQSYSDALEAKNSAYENLETAFEDLRKAHQQRSGINIGSEGEMNLFKAEMDDKDVTILIKTAQIERLERELEQMKLKFSEDFLQAQTSKPSGNDFLNQTSNFEMTNQNETKPETTKYERRCRSAEENIHRLMTKEVPRCLKLQEGECQKLRKLISELQRRLKKSENRIEIGGDEKKRKPN